MKKLQNIFLIGPMGSGKSTVGKYLSKYLNMNFYDSDQEIELKTGVSISWIFDIEGEKCFRERESKIIKKLTKKKKIILSTGGGAILSKKSRINISKRGFVIYLSANIDTQIKRTKNDKNRPLLTNKKSIKSVLKKLSLKRNFLYEKISNFKIETDNINIFQIIKLILKELKNNKNFINLEKI
ncbi:shikimate kinase AroK [Buchnera aphidicola]|uniref:shikimate kinase AroK n=1 Tax=Buchnera aphidicola TaxID=9 RepID=UPI0030EEC346